MTMTVTVHRLKVMFLNAAGSEIRNLINVLDWFLGEKLLLPMALKGGMWKQRVETNVAVGQRETGLKQRCIAS